MALRLKEHPRGPKLTQVVKAKRFRSYCDMADWVEVKKNKVLHGLYFARADNITTLAGIREVHYWTERWPNDFWVEGRGCI